MRLVPSNRLLHAVLMPALHDAHPTANAVVQASSYILLVNSCRGVDNAIGYMETMNII